MKRQIVHNDTPQAIKDLLLDSLLEDFPVAFYWMDTNGVLLGASKTELKLLGLPSPEEFVGKYAANLSAKAAWENSARVIKEDKAYACEEVHTDENGEKTYFYSVKKPLHNAKGKVTGLLGIAIDITDRKHAEEYRLKNEAAQKVISFSNLVAGSIAHELKNPLAGIKMQMESLQAIDFDKILPQTTKSLLQEITTAIIKTVNSTSYVIDGMLKKVRTFATGEVHHGEFKELSITADVEELLATYPFKNDEQDLVKTVFNTRFKYFGDSILTAHVLSNLMKNALHAIEQTDKNNATITITTKTGTDFNLLIFRDTATGVPKDFVDKVFDQFETKKDVHGGTGLGLAFCKSVMKDSYGGDITCNSEDGKYTEFVLSFPNTAQPPNQSL